jgi:hypothetical protein
VAGGYYGHGAYYGGAGYYDPGPGPAEHDYARGYYDDRRPPDQDCRWARAWVYMPDGSAQNTRVRVCRDERGYWGVAD